MHSASVRHQLTKNVTTSTTTTNSIHHPHHTTPLYTLSHLLLLLLIFTDENKSSINVLFLRMLSTCSCKYIIVISGPLPSNELTVTFVVILTTDIMTSLVREDRPRHQFIITKLHTCNIQYTNQQYFLPFNKFSIVQASFHSYSNIIIFFSFSFK